MHQPRVMHHLRVMNDHGHVTRTWDPVAAQAGNPEAQAAVREAERIFNEVRSRGGRAVRSVPGQTAQYIDTFDPLLEHVLLLPHVVGG